MGRVREPGLYEGYGATKEIGNKEILGKGALIKVGWWQVFLKGREGGKGKEFTTER